MNRFEFDKAKESWEELKLTFAENKKSWETTRLRCIEVKEEIRMTRRDYTLLSEFCYLLKEDKMGIWFNYKDFTFLLPLMKFNKENIKKRLKPILDEEREKLSTEDCGQVVLSTSVL